MTPKIIHYKDVQAANEVELTIPEKIKGKYLSYASRKGQKGSVYLKTPTMVLTSVGEDHLQVKFKEDSPLNDFLQTWDKRCKEIIFENSERFFNGKRFSEQKIESSYVPTVKDCCLDIKVPSDVIIRDQREAPRSLSELTPGQEVIMIINLDGLVYTATTIGLIVNAVQIKVYIDDKLQEFCISQEDDESTEHNETPVSPQSQPLPEQTSSELQELQESGQVSDNDDEKNLF